MALKALSSRDKKRLYKVTVTESLTIKPVIQYPACAWVENGKCFLRVCDETFEAPLPKVMDMIDNLSEALSLESKENQYNAHMIVWTPNIMDFISVIQPVSEVWPPDSPRKFLYKNWLFCSTKCIIDISKEDLPQLAEWMTDTFVSYVPPMNKKGGYGYVPLTITQMFQSLLEMSAAHGAERFLGEEIIKELKEKSGKKQSDTLPYSTLLQACHNKVIAGVNYTWFMEKDFGNEVPILGRHLKHPDVHMYNSRKYLPKAPMMVINKEHVNEILYNISHWDLSMAYGSCAILYKYPNGSWVRKSNIPKVLKDLDSHDVNSLESCYKLDVTFHNLQVINYPWVHDRYVKATDYTDCKQGIITAKTCDMEITDVQYYSLKKTYKWDKMVVHRAYSAKKEKLPDFVIQTVLRLAKKRLDPTTPEFLQKIYKQLIERVYGKGVSRIDYEEYRTHIINDAPQFFNDDEITRYKFRKYLIRPEQSIYMQDYARATIINIITQMNPKDVYYVDTDCICFETTDFYNEIIRKYNADTLSLMQTYVGNNLPAKTFGQFKNEVVKKSNNFSQTYTEFIYDSTKRYAGSYQTTTGPEEFITAAGIIKGTVESMAKEQQISIVKNFKDLLVKAETH